MANITQIRAVATAPEKTPTEKVKFSELRDHIVISVTTLMNVLTCNDIIIWFEWVCRIYVKRLSIHDIHFPVFNGYLSKRGLKSWQNVVISIMMATRFREIFSHKKPPSWNDSPSKVPKVRFNVRFHNSCILSNENAIFDRDWPIYRFSPRFIYAW